MRTFLGYRPNPPSEYLARGTAGPVDEPQYEGVIFNDGSVALRWRTEFRSTSVWDRFRDFYQVHGHPEYGTRLVFDDGLPMPCPAGCDQLTEALCRVQSGARCARPAEAQVSPAGAQLDCDREPGEPPCRECPCPAAPCVGEPDEPPCGVCPCPRR